MHDELKNHEILKSTVCSFRQKLVKLKVSKGDKSESKCQGRNQCFGSDAL